VQASKEKNKLTQLAGDHSRVPLEIVRSLRRRPIISIRVESKHKTAAMTHTSNHLQTLSTLALVLGVHRQSASHASAFVAGPAIRARPHVLAVDEPLNAATLDGPVTNPNVVHRDEYDGDAWVQGFRNVEQEGCYELEGDFPTDLVGTFFQNGHTKFHVGEDDFHIHPFDADGMVQAVTFSKGRAWFRNRFVQTPGYLEELERGKVCKRGVFGTARNKGKWWSNIFDVDFKNVANTHVLFLDNRLFALWEAGLPYQMDPVTLETIGESTLYGALDGKRDNRYAAHYKIDPATGNVCGFAVLPGDKDPANTHKLTVMEHEGDKLLYKKTYPFGGLGVAHDTAITENYFIFLQAPFKFKPLPLILGLKGASQCIEFDQTAEHARLILVPRGENRDGKEPVVIEVPPFFSFHTANAFEDSDGTVVIDMIVAVTNTEGLATLDTSTGYPDRPIWEDIDWTKDVPANQLKRIRVDPAKKEMVSETVLSGECGTVEFPVVNPDRVGRPYQYTYCATSASARGVTPLQGIAKIDVTTGKLLEKWLPEPHQYVTEATFCPKAGGSDAEDDGYLVTYLLDGRNGIGEVVVLDAANPGKGPISSSPLQGWSVNHSLHGTFVPGFTPEYTDRVKASFERN
jgi:all-trans-8'-apo-beta-carotenal 15,15'-oxygenase